jgi:hypothetical protein
MIKPGDVISYQTMCQEEKFSLQKGMNYHLAPGYSVILMSTQTGAPYSDRVEGNGKTLIYEGHDIPKTKGVDDPKKYDQPMKNPSGSLTQNGMFFKAAGEYKKNAKSPELVKVYEKIRPGIWAYNGLFELQDAWMESDGRRDVFKFKLAITDESLSEKNAEQSDIDHTRIIPSEVKRIVWARDKGKCVECGAVDNLHFDHIIPYSKGGSSRDAENIQLLCARHNLAKRDRIG